MAMKKSPLMAKHESSPLVLSSRSIKPWTVIVARRNLRRDRVRLPQLRGVSRSRSRPLFLVCTRPRNISYGTKGLRGLA